MIAHSAVRAWEAALWCRVSSRLARWRVGTRTSGWQSLAIEVTLESSFADAVVLRGAGIHPAAYWVVAAVCAAVGLRGLRGVIQPFAHVTAVVDGGVGSAAARAGFRPVEEIDSINYLHYLIDWMANRATPYTFATNYVAFWELSFLPAWPLTGVDLFFPLLALKAVILMALALWLLGREIELRGQVLAWTVFGALTMRHYWFEYSGVPTLKNDALHGVGFVLLALAVVRKDTALLALGAAFAFREVHGNLSGRSPAMLLVARGLRTWVAVAGVLAFDQRPLLRAIVDPARQPVLSVSDQSRPDPPARDGGLLL